MAIKEYRDFVLVADDAQKDQAGAVVKFTVNVFDSPVGQGEKKETVTVPDDLHKQIRRLEERRLDQEVERQIELGETLAGLLLPAYARALFGASLARLPEDEGLRLRLRLADELADIPWEYTYIQDARGEHTASSFLALDPRISIVRHEAVAMPGDWFTAPGSRRIVVAMASPKPYPKLEKLPAEQAALKQTLGGIAGVTAVYVPETIGAKGQAGGAPGATLKDLLAALMERADVFHFSGHGEFTEEMGPALDSKIGKGVIALADEDNRAVVLPADRLGELLRGKGVRLAVLGACETGRRDGYNVWSSVAAALLKAGIPAVVAMQFTIQDTLAAAFNGALYRALVTGFTVDEAVALGRAAIRVEAPSSHVRDWGVPVLYLRAPGGRIFNPVSDQAARQQAEETLGHLFEQHVRTVASTGRMIGAVLGTMQAETVAVDQTVDERASGLVLGAYVVNLQGGWLVVRQKADVVDGTVIGAMTPSLPTTALEGQQAMAKIEEWLGIVRPAVPEPGSASPTCPSCGQAVRAGDKFCLNCGSPLPAGPKFCPQCGKPLAAGAKFCIECGAKVRTDVETSG